MSGQSSASKQPERLESILDRFELTWQKGKYRPYVEDFVPSVAASPEEGPGLRRQELLQELIKVDLEYRWRSPQHPARVSRSATPFPDRPLIEDYVRNFPDLGPIGQLPLDLITEEYRVRQRWGDQPAHAEYFARFPSQAERLRQALQEMDAELATEFGDRKGTMSGADSASPLRLLDLREPEDHSAASVFHKHTCPLGELERPVEHAPRPPATSVGRFEIKDLLGTGAFGSVWRAYDPEMRREVAVKMPRAGHFFSRDEEERFLREARCAGQLHHPGIVGVHDVGRSQGTFYIVSELVRGVNLGEIASRRRLDFAESARIIAEVADALDHAHHQGVIHRDIKPSNILLEVRRGEEGPDDSASREEGVLRPRLTDFGLALRDASEVTMTQDGQVLGTPAYMSPEQVRNPHAVDGRSDIYSLGVVLYELLTGEVPFRGVSRMVLLQVAQDEPRPPRLLNDEIPRDLETICLRCLQKDAGQRYRSARALAMDLRRWLAGEPIQARAIGRLDRSLRWARRNPAWIAFAALAALTIVALTGAFAAMVLILVSAAAVGFGLFHAKRAAEASQLAQDADREQKKFAAAFELAIKQCRQAREEKDRAVTAEKGAREQFRLVWRLLQRMWSEPEDNPATTYVPDRHRARLLQDGLDMLDLLAESADADSLLLRELAAAYACIGDLQRKHRNLSPRDDLASYRKSLELYGRLARILPENGMVRQEMNGIREKISQCSRIG